VRRVGSWQRSAGTLSSGLVSQVAVSGTNLLLTVVVARVAGAASLGGVFVGFTCYQLAVGFQRSLLTEPLVVATASSATTARAAAARAATTLSLTAGAVCSTVVLVLGLVAEGYATGLLAFAPWIAPALLQDLLRAVLFRDGQGATAARADVLWFGTSAAAVVPAVAIGSSSAIVAAWGLGSLAAMALSFRRVRARPSGLLEAVTWWRQQASGLGKWLALASASYTAGSQGFVFLTAALVSAAELGGLRAVQSLFAPLTLLIPAIALPALPALTRVAERSVARARRLAGLLSLMAVTLTACYVLPAASIADQMLRGLFGEPFVAFRDLLLPVAVGQFAAASALGFELLAKARAQGKLYLVVYAANSAVTLACTAALAPSYGVLGAAWALAAGAVTSAVVLAWSTRRAAPLDGTTSGSQTVNPLPPLKG
jgi:O-antigen/teichoic acid export membrane protein